MANHTRQAANGVVGVTTVKQRRGGGNHKGHLLGYFRVEQTTAMSQSGTVHGKSE